MTTSRLNAAIAEMTPDEIRLIPRFVDTWIRAGWMEQDEADEWKLGALAWAEFHRISPESDPC